MVRFLAEQTNCLSVTQLPGLFFLADTRCISLQSMYLSGGQSQVVYTTGDTVTEHVLHDSFTSSSRQPER